MLLLAPRHPLASGLIFLIPQIFHTSRIFSPAAFFLGHLLLSETTSFQESFGLVPGLHYGTKSPIFTIQIVNTQKPVNYLLAVFNFSLLTGACNTHHFYLVQVLSKLTASLYRLQPTSSRFLLENSKVQFQTFSHTHPHAPSYLLPVSIHNVSYFFFTFMPFFYVFDDFLCIAISKSGGV